MNNLVPQCFAADGVRPDQPEVPLPGQPWQWSLRNTVEGWPEYLRRRIPMSIAPQNPIPGENNIQETVLSDFERRKLLEWAYHDQVALDGETHRAGETSPDTILVQLREWLDGTIT